MKPIRLFLVIVSSVAAALLSSCGGAVSDAYVIENDPGHVESIADGNLVTVTDQAAERLQLGTAPVTGSRQQLVVPAAAVFVDTAGVWWVYEAHGPNEFIRAEVEISRIQGSRAVLRSGPPAGTSVVTVGVAELYGIEEEVGH
jgi:hypothetical protein